MKDKFLQYMKEVGLRYAIHWAKYEGIRCGIVQVWIYDTTHNTAQAVDTKEVARIYMQA